MGRTDAPAGRRRGAAAVLVVALALQVAVTVVLYDGHGWGLRIPDASRLQPIAFVPFAVAVGALSRSRLSRRTTAVLVLGVTALLQLVALTRPPQTSNDDLRYIWDAKVQLAGVDPYRYAPDDPALARLHEPDLFTHHDCALPTGCALLNRPTVHTIYPPVAQGAFDAIRIVSIGDRAGHGGQLAFQGAAAAGVVAIALLLLVRTRRRGDPAWWSALWGWCPIAVSEFGNNAHIDWVAILLSLAAIGAYTALRPAWAGALLGGAIATKLYPALLAPSLLRRHPVRVGAAAVAVVVAGYIPHVAAVGDKVIGYLPGYLDEEGYDSGSRLVLVGRLVPHPFDTVVGALLLLGLAFVCWRRTDPARPELSAVWLVGAAFLIISPNYGWYAGLLVALVAITGRWYWLPVALAPTCTYLYGHSAGLDTAIYAAAGAATLAGALLHRAGPSRDATPIRNAAG